VANCCEHGNKLSDSERKENCLRIWTTFSFIRSNTLHWLHFTHRHINELLIFLSVLYFVYMFRSITYRYIYIWIPHHKTFTTMPLQNIIEGVQQSHWYMQQYLSKNVMETMFVIWAVHNFKKYIIWKLHYAIRKKSANQNVFYLISAWNSKYHRRTKWIPIRVEGKGGVSLLLSVAWKANEKDFMGGLQAKISSAIFMCRVVRVTKWRVLVRMIGFISRLRLMGILMYIFDKSPK
jgi:hypothetical protein